ncbi:hypothetical protein ARMSODRAFT_978644 [Armillaria solidipes]|uniref:Uncharacterized protein n=1 Tax=Armillaria solidipes TaxID=1076256 RepID=A0A2H3B266_9AGAR|nr:hypothetical protein ARMSODRAFT_978644 [Armillaria solidipes]
MAWVINVAVEKRRLIWLWPRINYWITTPPSWRSTLDRAVYSIPSGTHERRAAPDMFLSFSNCRFQICEKVILAIPLTTWIKIALTRAPKIPAAIFQRRYLLSSLASHIVVGRGCNDDEEADNIVFFLGTDSYEGIVHIWCNGQWYRLTTPMRSLGVQFPPGARNHWPFALRAYPVNKIRWDRIKNIDNSLRE